MKICVCTLFALASALGSIRAEDKNPKPAPLVQLASASVKDGKLTGIATQSVTRVIDRTVTMLVDGKPVTVTKKVPVVETVNITVEYAMKNTKATTVDGKEIAADDLAAMVKDAKSVAVFPTASKPTAEALKKMPEGTVLIEILAESK